MRGAKEYEDDTPQDHPPLRPRPLPRARPRLAYPGGDRHRLLPAPTRPARQPRGAERDRLPQGDLFRTLDRLGRERGVTIRHEPVALPAALRPRINGAFEALDFMATYRETLTPVAAPARLGGAA